MVRLGPSTSMGMCKLLSGKAHEDKKMAVKGTNIEHCRGGIGVLIYGEGQ